MLSRDHHGMSPLFYHVGEGRIAFGSCIKALLGLPWVPKRPNLLHVSKIVCAWAPDGVQSAYRGAFSRVPAAAYSNDL